MSREIAKETRYFYMLDDFQKDVARQAKAEGSYTLESIGSSLLMISTATVQGMFHADVDKDGTGFDLEYLVKDIGEMLWQVAHIAECAGISLSDLAEYAVDAHQDGIDKMAN